MSSTLTAPATDRSASSIPVTDVVIEPDGRISGGLRFQLRRPRPDQQRRPNDETAASRIGTARHGTARHDGAVRTDRVIGGLRQHDQQRHDPLVGDLVAGPCGCPQPSGADELAGGGRAGRSCRATRARRARPRCGRRAADLVQQQEEADGMRQRGQRGGQRPPVVVGAGSSCHSTCSPVGERDRTGERHRAAVAHSRDDNVIARPHVPSARPFAGGSRPARATRPGRPRPAPGG